MRRYVILLAGAALVAASTSCAYQRAQVNYSDSQGIKLSAKGWDGKILGVVSARERGPIWSNCTKLAKGSVWVLIEETKKLGGNAIGEIRWVPQSPERTSTDPVCKQKYGWFLIWPTLATPLFQSAMVEGQAYLIEDDASLPAGAYLIPDSQDEQWRLAEAIAADMLSVAVVGDSG